MAKDVRVKITGDSKGLKKSVDSGTKSLKGFDKQAGITAGTLLKMGGGFLSITAVLGQAKKGFADLQSETNGISKVNAVLASTGGVAGVTSEMIEELTLSIQKTTKTSQDSAREVAALGLTFTNINKDVFPEYMRLANSMATITGGDMSASALQLGKALQDPVLGATALSRAGVNLTQQQKDQIKVFQKSGQVMKAQEVILKELRKEFEGAAETVGGDFFGTVTRALNAVDDFRKAFLKGLGTGAFGGVQKLFEYIIDNQEVIGENFRRIAYDFTHNFIIDAMKNMGKLVKFAFDGWNQLGDLWESIFGDSFFSMVLKGWKMIFAYIEGGWYIFFTIIDDIENTFDRAINNIGIGFKMMFNEVKGANPFTDFDAESANIQLAKGLSDAILSDSTKKAWEKLNEDIFAINMGLDVRNKDAQYQYDKSIFDLAGTSTAGSGGLLSSDNGGVGGVGKTKTGEGLQAGVSYSAGGTAEDQYYANRMKKQAEYNAEVLRQRAEDAEKEKEETQIFYDETASIIENSQTAMVDSINFFANKSIETFTQMSTSIIASTSSILKSIGDMGGGGGLFGKGSSILGGLGILGAGIGLIGGVASALTKDEGENIDNSYSSEEQTGLSSSTPSTTVTRPQQTVNNYTTITLQTGAYMGDEESLRQTAVLFNNIVTENNLSMA